MYNLLLNVFRRLRLLRFLCENANVFCIMCTLQSINNSFQQINKYQSWLSRAEVRLAFHMRNRSQILIFENNNVVVAMKLWHNHGCYNCDYHIQSNLLLSNLLTGTSEYINIFKSCDKYEIHISFKRK